MDKFCFNKFNLKKELIKIIKEIGYNKPTDIQISCIPLFLKGYDILAIAKTGSGKTASFVLPLLNNILLNNILQVLVIVPTRELAIQIKNSFILFSKYILGIKIISLYGGQRYNIQYLNLKNKPNIVIATPGRLLDHLKRNTLNLYKLKYLILDEADEMFKMGFINDVKKIISFIKNKHQTALFSATMSNSIKNIIFKFMNSPKEINLSISHSKNLIPKNIHQYYCIIYSYKFKLNILMKFLQIEKFRAVIIFVRTKIFTLKVSNFIKKYGYNCSPLNGDMNQNLREKVISDFRNGKISILIATDIASRGLDIENIDLVINYDLPIDFKLYIHRIGRTGRSGKFGKSISFIEKNQLKFLYILKDKIKSKIEKILIPNNKVLLENNINKFIKFINKYSKNKINNIFYNKILNILNKELKINNKNLIFILIKIVYKNKFYLINS